MNEYSWVFVLAIILLKPVDKIQIWNNPTARCSRGKCEKYNAAGEVEETAI